MAESGLQLFGGNWTERKLDALGQYLQHYARALSKQRFHRVYIDAFAGTGYREEHRDAIPSYGRLFPEDQELAQPEPQEFLEGSARIALKIQPEFHQYIFIELRERRAAELQSLRREFPGRASAIDIRCAEANAAIRQMCRAWALRSRGVLFLDPYGMQVEWPTIEAVAKTGAIDVWILFPFAVNRLLTRDPRDISATWRKRLTAFFGTDEWLRRFYRQKTIHDMFRGPETIVEKSLTLEGLGAFYQERLQTIFPIVASNPSVLRNTRNCPLFQLFFAAANPGRGGDIALKIASHILTNI